jgi:peptidyl-prolyl cis-trans isomerase C
MLIKSRILLISAALLSLSACNANKGVSDAKAAPAATTAATVNGTTISTTTVDMLVKQRAAQGQPDNPQTRKDLVDHLTMQLLIAQEASKKGLDKTSEVIEQIDFTKQQILANAFIQDYIKNNPVTDAMLSTEYDKVKAQMSGNEYKARHILVASEADAKDIIAKLKKDPKAFEALAKEKSTDPGSKVNGGDLGWFDAHSMVPEFSDAVSKLSKGQVTQDPVKSRFGYHVIMLEDTRAKQVPPLDQIKEPLKQQVQQQNLKKLMDDMKAKAKIEIAAIAVPAPAAPKDATPILAPAEPAKK